jgi:sugar phosphate isomerase/epimerase
MNLSLSTSWNAFRYEDGGDMVREIMNLGFANLELSFNLTSAMVDDIAALMSSGKIKITSLHNFCPIPDGVERKLALPDFYSLASLNNEERGLAIKFAKRTIDTAKKLNAQAVVLHTGRIEIEDKTRALMDVFESQGKDSDEFIRLKENMTKEREEKIAPYFTSALESLGELSLHAKNLGIKLGIENRYYYREIPSFEEVGIILDKFKDRNIFYWHDVGHAQVWENLGFPSSVDYLKRYSDKLLGMHLHDVKKTEDHLAPLLGDIDFKKFMPFIKKDTIKVMEAHYPSSSNSVQKGARYLEEIFKGVK